MVALFDAYFGINDASSGQAIGYLGPTIWLVAFRNYRKPRKNHSSAVTDVCCAKSWGLVFANVDEAGFDGHCCELFSYVGVDASPALLDAHYIVLSQSMDDIHTPFLLPQTRIGTSSSIHNRRYHIQIESQNPYPSTWNQKWLVNLGQFVLVIQWMDQSFYGLEELH